MIEHKRERLNEPLLDVPELANALKVGKPWVYRQVRLKKIPVIRCGKYLRFRLSAVIRQLEG